MDNNKPLEEQNVDLKKLMGEIQAELDNIEQRRRNMLRVKKIIALSAISPCTILMFPALYILIASRTATWFLIFLYILMILILIGAMVVIVRADH